MNKNKVPDNLLLFKSSLLAFLLLFPLLAFAHHQEEGSWSSLFDESNGIKGIVYALAADTGGNIIVGGSFSEAGPLSVNNIAIWNGISWEAMGEGLDGAVYAIEINQEGFVYAGGEFLKSGTTILNGIAKWDGLKWSSLGSGIAKEQDLGNTNPSIQTIAINQEGHLYVGGDFTTVNGVTARGIAFWDGGDWSQLGQGVDGHGCLDLPLDDVYAISITGINEVHIGGNFKQAGGVIVNGIAKWNGEEWSALGGGVEVESCAQVNTIIEYDGKIYVGGGFSNIGEVQTKGIAMWSGSEWEPLDGGVYGGIESVFSLAATDDGIIVGGNFSAAGNLSTGSIVKWTKAGWKMLGSGISSPGFPYAIEIVGANAYVGGLGIVEAGGHPSFGLALWETEKSVNTEKAEQKEIELERVSVYPNPLIEDTTIRFYVSSNSRVKIRAYNLLGQMVSTVYDRYPNNGENSAIWQTNLLPTGIYVIKLEQNGNSRSFLVTKL